MSYENVKTYFETIGMEDRIKLFDESSATVSMAADAVGCEPKQIAKSLSFLVEDAPILIIAAGNVKIDNSKYKAKFHQKAKMIPVELIDEYVGHTIGGVCPFAVKEGVTIYLDESLKQNAIVYPAAGNDHSAVKLSISELEECCTYTEWIDVCKEM